MAFLNRIGQKLSHAGHTLGRKANHLSVVGRKFGDAVSDVNRVAQKVKGEAILASGEFAPAVAAGFVGLDAASKGVSQVRRDINALARQ